MKKILICLICLLTLCGCAPAKAQTQGGRITVVTTIFPLYDFARAVGGDNIDLKMLIRPGTEVHSYDPLPSDMAAVSDCDAFIYIGGESDTWAKNLLETSNINSLALINVVEPIHEEEHHHHSGDEHIWTSPKNAVLMVESICDFLCEADYENASKFKENSRNYIKKISDASKEIKKVVSAKNAPFILVADRFPFAYLAHEYGIEYEAAFGGCAISTDISLKTMSNLTEVINARGVKTIFCTEMSNRNIADALSNQTGVKVLELHSAHNVTSDDFESEITYVDILYQNLEALKEGLS